MPRTMTAGEWLNQLMHDHQRRIDSLETEILQRQHSIDQLAKLAPFATCAECGAEDMRSDIENLEEGMALSRKFGKESMLCPWCDRQRVYLHQVMVYNRSLAWSFSAHNAEAQAEHAAISFLERAFA